VTWSGLDSFPFNEPLKFLFVCDWLDSPTGMPMAFAEEGDGLHAWRPSDKRQAWDRSRSLEEMVPDDDLCSRDAYEYAARIRVSLHVPCVHHGGIEMKPHLSRPTRGTHTHTHTPSLSCIHSTAIPCIAHSPSLPQSIAVVTILAPPSLTPVPAERDSVPSLTGG